MAINSSVFQSKRGLISLSVNPVDLPLGAAAGTTEELSEYDFSDNSDKTWGLATKFYVLSTIDEHNNDKNAHSGIFAAILSSFEDIVTSSGTFCFNRIRDEHGNSLRADGLFTYQNGGKRGYVVTSKSPFSSFDSLSGYAVSTTTALSTEVDKKEYELIEGANIRIERDTVNKRTRISADSNPYTLPKATSVTLGGVYLDTAIRANGENPVVGSAIWSALSAKQDALSSSDSITVDGGDIYVSFGMVAENESRPVDGNSVYAALRSKQEAISFDTEQFQLSSNSVSLKFGHVSEGSSAIVSGGEIFDYVSRTSSRMMSHVISEDDMLALHTTLHNGCVNQLADIGPIYDKTMTVSFPLSSSEGYSRRFSILRKIDGHIVYNVCCTLQFPSDCEFFYSGENPFAQILCPAEGTTEWYQYDFNEIAASKFRVSRTKLSSLS